MARRHRMLASHSKLSLTQFISGRTTAIPHSFWDPDQNILLDWNKKKLEYGYCLVNKIVFQNYRPTYE
jgi:hypothetical protein